MKVINISDEQNLASYELRIADVLNQCIKAPPVTFPSISNWQFDATAAIGSIEETPVAAADQADAVLALAESEVYALHTAELPSGLFSDSLFRRVKGQLVGDHAPAVKDQRVPLRRRVEDRMRRAADVEQRRPGRWLQVAFLLGLAAAAVGAVGFLFSDFWTVVALWTTGALLAVLGGAFAVAALLRWKSMRTVLKELANDVNNLADHVAAYHAREQSPSIAEALDKRMECLVTGQVAKREGFAAAAPSLVRERGKEHPQIARHDAVRGRAVHSTLRDSSALRAIAAGVGALEGKTLLLEYAAAIRDNGTVSRWHGMTPQQALEDVRAFTITYWQTRWPLTLGDVTESHRDAALEAILDLRDAAAPATKLDADDPETRDVTAAPFYLVRFNGDERVRALLDHAVGNDARLVEDESLGNEIRITRMLPAVTSRPLLMGADFRGAVRRRPEAVVQHVGSRHLQEILNARRWADLLKNRAPHVVGQQNGSTPAPPTPETATAPHESSPSVGA